MLKLGQNVTSGDVTTMLVKVGDTIEQNQPVIELETDKATIEVPSSVAGVVKDIKVKAGDKVKVGQAILSVEDGAAASPPVTPKQSAVKTNSAEADVTPKPAQSKSARTEADVTPKQE